MAKYELTCSCGDTYQVEGATTEAAVDGFMSQMTPEMVQEHMSAKHAGQTPPTPEQARQGFIANAKPL
jgi:hypothetical protein